VSAIDELVAEFAGLPGIGRKTAQRLTYFLLKQPRDVSARLARAVEALAERVHACSRCGNLTESDPCGICADPRRDQSTVCVVEEASDVLAIERAGEFRGVFHVLGGRLSPLDGVGPENLTIPGLVERVRKGGIREVILATNPTAEGDATAWYLQTALQPLGTRVTRIARGIPAGSTLEYSDRTVVNDALSGRREL